MIRLFAVVATAILWLAGPVAAFAPNGFAVLAALLGLAGLATLAVQGGARAVLSAPGLGILALLVLLMMASSLWALDGPGVWRTLAGLVPPLLAAPFALGALRLLDAAARDRLDRALVGGFWIALGLLCLTALTKGFPVETARLWIGSHEEPWDPTSISRGLVVLTLLVWPVVALAWRSGRIWLGWLALAAVAVVLVAGHTLSARAAFLAAVAAATLAFMGGRRAVAVIVAVFAVLVVLMPLVLPVIANPVDHHDFLYRHSTSALHRLYIWDFTIGKITQRPFLGFGLDGARNLPGAHTPTPVGGYMLSMHPHNGALQIWVELGVGGAVLAAALLQSIARYAWRHGTATLAGLVAAAFIVAHLSFGIWQAWWVGLLALAAFAGAVSAREDQLVAPVPAAA